MLKMFIRRMGVSLLLVLMVNITGFGQSSVFTENFEPGTSPDSVSAVGTATWAKSSHLYFDGAYSDSCALVNAADSAVLTTDAFSTAGGNFVKLKFRHICRIEFFDKAIVEVSADNGTTWTQLDGTHYEGASGSFANTGKFSATSYSQWTGLPTDVPDNTWWKEEVFDISSIAANASQVKVRFHVKDINNMHTAYNYAWYVDGIEVFASADELVPPTIAMIDPIHEDSVFYLGPFDIHADVTDASGIDTVKLSYQINSQPWQTVGMNHISGDHYMGTITKTGGFVLNDTIRYRVIAKDNSGSQNVTVEPNVGHTQFILYTSPPPANCSNTINTFPYLENFETFNASTNTLGADWERSDVNHKWAVESFATSGHSSSTGPSMDHTLGTDAGTYIYTEGNTGTSGNVAWITTPCIDLTGLNQPRLSFFYHMYGYQMGSLEVKAWYGNKWVSIMTPIVGEQHSSGTDPWTEVLIDLTPYKSITKIRFEGTKSGTYGDIAIDDVSIYEPINDDAGVTAIQAPGPLTYSGSQDVKVKLTNFGGNVLSSATINWSVDDVAQTAYNWSGYLSNMQSEDSVVIGTYSYPNLGDVNVKAWVTNANGNTDGNANNDTSKTSTYVCASALNGTYTIGGTGADYNTFAEAIFSLETCGITGPVVFNINTGVYTEELEFTTPIIGASAANTVTFQSATGDTADVTLEYTITGSSDNVIKIDGVSHLVFKNLTIHGIDDGSSDVIDILGTTSNIRFEGNYIHMDQSTSSYDRLIYIPGSAQNLVIHNNTLRGAYYGIYGYRYSSPHISNITITNNKVLDFGRTGISIKYADTLTIEGNHLESNKAYYGIESYICTAPVSISGNTVISEYTSTMYGIRIYKNEGTTANPTRVANNFVHIEGSSSNHIGIYDYTNNNIDIVFNTVNIHQGGSSSAAYKSDQSYSTIGTNGRVYNNTFFNHTAGYAYYIDDTTAVTESDYNNLYSKHGNVGRITSARSTLADVQSAWAREANSVSIDPYLIGKDYHMALVTLNDKGTPFAGITTDIEGDTRNASTPDIGCDEFDLPPFDAGIESFVTPTTQDTQYYSNPIVVKLRNYGTDVLTALTIKYMVDGGTPVSYSWTGSLQPSTSTNVTLPNYTVPGGTFNLKAYTELAADINTQNDTAALDIYGWPEQALEVYSLVSPTAACGLGNEDVEVKIKNVGYDTIQGGVSIALNFNGAGYGTAENISATILPGAYYTHTFSTPVDMAITDQDSTFKFAITATVAGDPTQTDDTLKTTVKSKYVPNDPAISDETVYHGTSIALTAVSNANIRWYSNATTTSVLKYGDTYVTPALTDTTSYFLQAVSSSLCKSNKVEMTVNVLDIPAIDAKLQDIIVVDGCGLDQEDVEVEIYNYGTDSIKGDMMVSYRIDDGAWTTPELWDDTLAPGEAGNFVLAQKALLDAPNQDTTYVITAKVTHVSDPNHFNDTLISTTLESKFTPDVPTLSNIDVVYYTTGTFTSTFSGDVNWYDQANATIGLATGSSFTTPELFDTTSYWVEYENTANNCRSDRQEVKANVTGIPAIDLGIAEIITNSGCRMTSSEQISIKVFNNGTQATTSATTASFRVANGSFITPETLPAIAAGDTLTYTFTASANLYYGVDSTIAVKAYVVNADDNFADNDSTDIDVESNFTPAVPTASDVTVLYGSQATLSATSSHAINWYEEMNSTSPLLSNSATYTTGPVYGAEDYFAVSQSMGATDHEITYGGTSGTSSYAPYSSSYEYSWNQTIYPASEMNGRMIIDSIGFYVTNVANWVQHNQKIYIGVVSDSVATTTKPDPIAEGYVLAYDDSIEWNGSGWIAVALTTPYEYNGTDHLSIYWENDHGGSINYGDPYPSFRYKYMYGSQYHYRIQYKSSSYSFPSASYSYRSKYGIDVKFYGRIPQCESDRVQVDVDHFPLPPADLKVLAIDVNSGCGLGNETVTVTYLNQGSDSLKADYTAKFQIDALGYTSPETVPDTITFGDTLSYTFTALADLSTITDTMYTITVVMNHPNDPHSNNDTLVLDSILSFYTPAAPVVTTPVNVPYGQSTVVNATAVDSIYWFADDIISSSFHQGSNYQTPVLYDTTSYWVASKAGQMPIAITEIVQYPSGTGQTPNYPSYISGISWDGIELTNLGSADADLGGYTLVLEGVANGSFTFPQGTIVPSGETAIALFGSSATTSVSDNVFAMTISGAPSSSQGNGYYLKDGAGTIIDAVATNGYTFPSSSAVTSSDWSGSVASSSLKAGISRVSFDNNDASDWIVSDASNPQNFGTMNSTLSLTKGGVCYSDRVEIVVETGVQPNEDAGMLSFEDLGTHLCPGNFSLEAKVKNFGADTLEQVDIVYSLNGGTSQSHTESGLNILSGDTTNLINFANLNLPSGYHTLKMWTAMPNGIADLSNNNDTLEVRFMVALNGTLTAGTAGSDFENFDDLFMVLDSVGLCGPTTINIQDGIYNFHYAIGEITGASATNTLTLQSASMDSSMVTLQYGASASADNYILYMNGTDHVTIQHLGFEATGTGNYGRAISLNGEADSNIIQNCKIVSIINSSTNNAGIYATGGKNTYNKFLNNYILNGYYGIYAKGTSGTSLDKGVVIDGNTVLDFYGYGIEAYYQDSVQITNNTVKKSNADGSYSQYGIYLYYCDNYNMVNGNTVIMNGSTGSTHIGIYAYYCDGSAGSMIHIYNNMVSMLSPVKGYGAQLYYSKYVNVFHNTFATYSQNTSSNAFSNKGGYYSGGSEQYIKNNIFANFGLGYAMYIDDDPAVEACDYNNLYSTSANLAYWAGAHSSLSSLQATSNKDLNSLTIFPGFYGSTDLHTVELFLNDKATPVAEVTTDIDGEARDASTPDMGADEYTPSAIDAGAFALATPMVGGCFTNAEFVTITVRNYGMDTLKFANNNLSIDVSVTGAVTQTLPTFTVNTGKLAPGAYMDVVVSSNFDMSVAGDYTFNATATVAGETNMLNNAIQTTTINASPIVDVYPHEEDFESFTAGVPGTMTNGWYTDNGSFNWAVEDGPTSASSSGPSGGHDANSTIYVYTESSNGLTGDTARLYSTCLDFSSLSNVVMQFWYHKYGSSMGDLYVEALNSSNEWIGLDTILGQTHTSANDPWTKRTIDLSAYTGNISRVRFTAVRGSGGYGDMGIDDVRFFEPVPIDAGVVAITQPTAEFAPVGGDFPVEVTIENFGSNTLTSIPVKVMYDGNVVLNQTWTGTLAPYTTTQFAFTNNVNTIAGVKELKAYTALTGDAVAANDTTTDFFQGIETLTPNYSIDFEGPQEFVTVPGSDWERGTPAKTNINAAYSPVNAWVTKLSGDYSKSTVSYLYTPFFDLTSLGFNDTVTISFYHFMDMELMDDYGKVEYSVDDGNTWLMLGQHNDILGNNWYNQNDAGNHMFSDVNSGWAESSYKLDPNTFNTVPRVQFRFMFASDSYTTSEGWAIDDFKVTLPIVANNAGMASINTPGTSVAAGDVVTVDVDLVNDGNNVLTSIPVKYKVSGQSVVTDTWTGSLNPGATANFVFSQTYVSPANDYQLDVYTDLSGDPFHSNDTITKGITATAAQFDVGVSKILSPDDTLNIGSTYNVIVRIKNYGTDAQTSIPVEYTVLGNTTQDTWTGNLLPGDSVDFTFAQGFVSMAGNFQICAETKLSTDAVPTNDETCKSLYGTVGINEIGIDNFYLLQNVPNPANNTTEIQFVVPNADEVQLEVVNTLGQTMMNNVIDANSGYNKVKMDVSKLEAGLYHYVVIYKGYRLTKTMVITR